VLDQIGHGQVITIDIEDRSGRPQHPRITYLTGSSTDPLIVGQVKQRVRNSRVMAILDSDHREPHVLNELTIYSELVHPGDYLIVEDTSVNGHPTFPGFGPGPMEAVEKFLARTDDFVIDERCERFLMTLHPRGYLKRKERSSSPLHTLFQVFPNLANGYTEGTSAVTVLKFGEWQHVVLKIPQGSSTGRIRVDPADRPCMIELADVVLRRGVDGSVLKSWTDAADIRAFSPIADLVLLPGDDGTCFLSTGGDPQFLLPEIDPALADQPLVFEARVRIDADLAPAVALLQSTAEAVERAAPIAQRDQRLMRNQQLSAEVRNLQAEQIAVVADYRRVHAINESLLSRLASEQERWLQEQAKLEAELKIVYQSRSWWLTAPFRRLFRAIR
jgi:cephalosporin hydroxylase